MADVLLFHHALGLTTGVVEFADRLRSAGHRVVTPDLFDGLTFGTIDDGVAHAEGVGFGVLIDRGVECASEMEGSFVVLGFSLGVLPAQKLAQTHSGVTGAVLCHSAVPPSAFSEAGWPVDVRLQFHFTEHDPWAEEDLPLAREIVGAVGGDLFVYPGDGHLVADSSAADFDLELASQISEHTLAFLAEASHRS